MIKSLLCSDTKLTDDGFVPLLRKSPFKLFNSTLRFVYGDEVRGEILLLYLLKLITLKVEAIFRTVKLDTRKLLRLYRSIEYE